MKDGLYMSDFKERLAQIMEKRNINQITLSKKTGIPKSAISQYLSGSFKPKRARVNLICSILDISPAWLMGYEEKENGILHTLSKEEQNLILLYRSSQKIKTAIDAVINHADNEKIVFRAAKSKGGIIPPGYEAMSAVQLNKLANAPETDEDL